MKWSVGTKISLGYASAVVMLIIIGIVSYFSLTRSVDDAEWKEPLGGEPGTESSYEECDRTVSVLD